MVKSRTLLLLALAAGGGYFFKHYRIEGLSHVAIVPRSQPARTIAQPTQIEAAPGDGIRIASFNIQVLGQSKLSKPQLLPMLAHVIRQFDVVAIQEVRSETQDVLPRLVDAINSTGAKYDYCIGPRLGRSVSKEQYAFVFNAATVELFRDSIYTVEDPDDLLHREPLVAGFRARGPPPEAAFTFTLVNIHTDPDEVPAELAALDDVYRAVRRDGRGEDDVILLGDLNAGPDEFSPLCSTCGLSPVVAGVPTNTRQSKTYDNLLVDQRLTSEYTGRWGVYDLERELGITREQALEVSDHLPVWAQFSIVEGGEPGHVAERGTPGTIRR